MPTISESSAATAEDAATFEGVEAQSPPAGAPYSAIWAIVLGAFSMVYLGIEFGFNSLIVDTVAGIPSIAETERLELIGRSVSGIGFTLIAWGLIAKRSHRPVSSKLRWMLLALCLCFPAMFFGQKALVDYVVNQSTGDQRLLSRYMSLLKTGLADGLIVIDGLPLDTAKTRTPEDKTFLALVGGLVYFNPAFLNTVEKNQDQIVDQVIRRMTSGNLDERYEEYLGVRQLVAGNWVTYKEGSKSYYSAISKSDNKAQEAWVELNNEVLSSWKAFDEGRTKWTLRWGEEADKFFPQAQKMFKQWSRCSTGKVCNDKADRKYRQEMMRIFAREDLPFQYWCVTGYLGLFVYPKDSYKVKGRQCPIKQEEFRAKFIEASSRKFQQKTGLAFQTSEAQFIASEKLRRDITATLKKRGINLPDSWQLTDRSAFVVGVRDKVVREAKQRFQRVVSDFSKTDSIQPGMDYVAFIGSSAVQDIVKSRMGDAYTSGMRFNWSKESFFTNSLEPMVKRQVKKEIGNLKQGAKAYENGQQLEENGKQSMRSILVPPIAIAFSLFFGLWNLLTLVSSILLLSMGRFSTPTVKRFVTTGAFLSILIAPFFLSNYYADNKVVGYFVGESRKTNPILGHAFDWVIRIQPLVYPAGKEIREYVGDIDDIPTLDITRLSANFKDFSLRLSRSFD